MMIGSKDLLPSREQALPGRSQVMPVHNEHYVNKTAIQPPFPANMEQIIVGMGCFWGAERHFWEQEGVYSTAVGYTGGFTPNPSYEEVCSGRTGHNEVVLVVFDPVIISLEKILTLFWEGHNPTQGMRQGNDRGTQYRSGIYYLNDAQRVVAEESKAAYQQALSGSGFADITTEILPAGDFYYAENYHQQYLAKNPGGYCGLGGTGVSCGVLAK